MDISVSRLNNRLALQLPAELPLGLVFVLGRVENVSRVTNGGVQRDGRKDRIQFELVDDGHRLRCQLTARAAAEVELNEGDEIRAGGHLLFDPHQADYYLLARDVAVVEASTPPPRSTTFASILADIQKRSEAAKLAPAELPPWVERIAPPEVQAEMGPTESEGGAEPQREETTAVSDQPASEETTPAAASEGTLNEELVTYLSEAMEDEGEVELTPDVLRELAPASTPPPVREVPAEAYEVPAPEAEDEPEPRIEPTTAAAPPRETDWLVILLIISFFVLTIAVVVTSVLLLVR